ncbi:MAG: sugar phosphate isomerase/epimerase family protein [Candidatus Bathyarchaeia archaeon]
MKIGYLTNYTTQEAEWAAKNGFKCLAIWFTDDLTEQKATTIKKSMAEINLEVSALAARDLNILSPDDKAQKINFDKFTRAMRMCPILGTNIISTNAFGNPEKCIEDNIPEYQRIFGECADIAEEIGIKIAIENCPKIRGYPIKFKNFAFSPYAWDLMFKAVHSKAIGLEFDPSHLIYMGIDYIKAAIKFKDRIYHVHAKDTEILHDVLSTQGIYGNGWWRYRIPGWGDVDWQKLIKILLEANYQGNIVIEHEDPVFTGPRFREGLLLALGHLSQFVP